MTLRFAYPARFRRDAHEDGGSAVAVRFPDLSEAMTWGGWPGGGLDSGHRLPRGGNRRAHRKG